jgi:hypothetical protein
MLAASRSWRGIKMNPILLRELDDVWETVFGKSRQETWAA